MLRILRLLGTIAVAVNAGCSEKAVEDAAYQDCTKEWFALAEERVSAGDGQGHGPDPGSLEWRSAIEFKLGIRGNPEVPPVESDQWCNYVDHYLFAEDT